MASLRELLAKASRDAQASRGEFSSPSLPPSGDSNQLCVGPKEVDVRLSCFIRSLLFTRGSYPEGFFSSWIVYEKFAEIFGFEINGQDLHPPSQNMLIIFDRMQHCVPFDATKNVEACWNYWQMARYFAQFDSKTQEQIVSLVLDQLKARNHG